MSLDRVRLTLQKAYEAENQRREAQIEYSHARHKAGMAKDELTKAVFAEGLHQCLTVNIRKLAIHLNNDKEER